jgi:hypothetical protein
MGCLGTVRNHCESFFVLQRFTRAGTYSAHLKQAIDLKMELELALKKYEELNIEPGRGQRSRVSSVHGAEAERSQDSPLGHLNSQASSDSEDSGFFLTKFCDGSFRSASPKRGPICSSWLGILSCPSASLPMKSFMPWSLHSCCWCLFSQGYFESTENPCVKGSSRDPQRIRLC